MYIFSATSSNHFVETVLNDRKLTSIEYHTDVWVRKVKLLVTRSAPWELTYLASLHISEQDGAMSRGYQVPILIDIDLADFVPISGL